MPPFHLDSREYGMRSSLETAVRPSSAEPIGRGSFEDCADPDRLGEPLDAYAFPDVPPEQAIVVPVDPGPPSVLLALEEPETGWDPDLQTWLDQQAG